MGDAEIVDEIQIDDRTYSLIETTCDNCGERHYAAQRWSGASYSHYDLPPDFRPEFFETFVVDAEATMSINATDILDLIKTLLEDAYDLQSGLRVDGSYLSMLLDYARDRECYLEERGLIDVLRGKCPRQPVVATEDIIPVFELGFAAAELRLKGIYEDAIIEGFRMQEGREIGLPAACAARKRQGRRSRRAIVRAAKGLFAEKPSLVHNRSATARHIESQRIDALRKADGTYLGAEAIVKHLRAAQRSGQL